MDFIKQLVAFHAQLEVAGGVMAKGPQEISDWWIHCVNSQDENKLLEPMDANARLLYQRWVDTQELARPAVIEEPVQEPSEEAITIGSDVDDPEPVPEIVLEPEPKKRRVHRVKDNKSK